jgi:hypothetical protein
VPDQNLVSNAELREVLQRQWISFIADDQSDVSLDPSLGELPITVYNRDRRIVVESMTSSPEWIEQQERFRLLAADWKGATAAFKAIVGIVE